MSSPLATNHYSESCAPEVVAFQDWDSLADQALDCLADAWKAMDALEASLLGDLPRWDAESLMTARKGTERARLALANLNRSLKSKRHQSGDSP
jgi:hypothetical protein